MSCYAFGSLATPVCPDGIISRIREAIERNGGSGWPVKGISTYAGQRKKGVSGWVNNARVGARLAREKARIESGNQEGERGGWQREGKGRGGGWLDHEAWFHGTVAGWVSCHRMPELCASCIMYGGWQSFREERRWALERERKLGKAFPPAATENTWFESRCHFRNTRCPPCPAYLLFQGISRYLLNIQTEITLFRSLSLHLVT